MKRWLLLAWAVAACRPAQQKQPFDLRIAVTGHLEAVGPSSNVDNWTIIANSLIFEPLVFLDDQDELVPAAAVRAELLPPQAVRVWLRPDATFSDGSKVVFEDVASSLEGTHLHASSEGDSILIRSDDVRTPVELALSFTYIHRRSPQGKELGTGAFSLAEEDNRHVLLRRRQSVPGQVSTVSIVSYPSPNQAFAHTLTGDADLLADVDSRWLEFVDGVPRLRVVRLGPSPYAAIVAFNPGRLSREERRSLVRAVHNDNIRKLAFGDDCIAPDEMPAYQPPLTGGGRPLDVLTFPFLERFGLAVRRALGERGGELQLRDFNKFVAATKAGDFDLATARERISPPIMAVRNWRTGGENNVFGYSNPKVDAALDAHDWAAAQRALDEDPPCAVICRPMPLAIMDSRITNISNKRFWRSIVQWEVQR